MSEFLCQLSLFAEHTDPPRTTVYAWDISHALEPCIIHIAMIPVLLLST